jgi:zinc transporter ZupT
MRYHQLWSYVVGAGIAVVVLTAIQGSILAFWLLAAILIAEGLMAYIASKNLPERERDDARAYALSAVSVGMIVLTIMLVAKYLW